MDSDPVAALATLIIVLMFAGIYLWAVSLWVEIRDTCRDYRTRHMTGRRHHE